jgi:hypothetical protein
VITLGATLVLPRGILVSAAGERKVKMASKNNVESKKSVYIADAQLEKCKVPELKKYLKEHGQNVTGLRDNLIQRAKGVRVLKLKTVADVSSQDDNTREQRQREKLTTPLGENIPDPNSLSGWTDSLLSLPDFFERDVYNYMVLRRKAKRHDDRSKVFYQDRHVHKVQCHSISDTCSHCLVKCKVIPSLPTSNKKENPDYTV